MLWPVSHKVSYEGGGYLNKNYKILTKNNLKRRYNAERVSVSIEW